MRRSVDTDISSARATSAASIRSLVRCLLGGGMIVRARSPYEYQRSPVNMRHGSDRVTESDSRKLPLICRLQRYHKKDSCLARKDFPRRRHRRPGNLCSGPLGSPLLLLLSPSSKRAPATL